MSIGSPVWEVGRRGANTIDVPRYERWRDRCHRRRSRLDRQWDGRVVQGRRERARGATPRSLPGIGLKAGVHDPRWQSRLVDGKKQTAMLRSGAPALMTM